MLKFPLLPDILVPMETKEKKLNTAEELIQIPRAKYEAQCDELKSLKEYVAELEKRLNWLMEQTLLSRHNKYAFTSERQEQLVMDGFGRTFNEAELLADSNAPEIPPEEETVEVSAHKRRRGGSVMDILPEDVPVEVVEHRLEGEDLVCPECGTEMVEIGKEIRKTLVIKPAQVYVREDRYFTYACPQCKQDNADVPIAQAAKEATLIPGSFASPEAVSYLMTQKYMMGSPLYRLEREFFLKEIYLTRQTMSNWLIRCSEDWLSPVYRELRRELNRREVLHADETTLQVLREPDRRAQSKSYMWLYRTSGDAENPIVLYEYTQTRKAEHPEKFLDSFCGYLHADGYSGYHSLPERFTVVGCLAHARRKFADALKVLPAEQRKDSNPARALEYFGKLAAWEKKFASLSAEKRYEQRLEQEKPVLDALYAWADSLRNVAPKSALGKALYYLREQREYLYRYLLDGRLEWTNNRAERSIKPFVIDRKNFLFANTPEGAQSSAVIFSLIETAKENGLDPYRYLLWVLTEAPKQFQDNPSWAVSLMPNNAPSQCRVK